MADVRKYTEQIAGSKKGKDVRASIVAAINEVSDENNTYNQVKADILTAQEGINQDVTANRQTQQAFNTDLQEAKTVQSDLAAKTEAGNTLLANLTKKVSDGNTLYTNLTKKVTEGNTTHKNLEADITAAGQAEASLEADITAAGQAERSLEADITAAGQAEASLEADITAAGQAERSLEADITAAGKAETDLEADISTANARITTMQNLVQNADQIKTGLEADLQQARQASENLVTNTVASVTEIQNAGKAQVDAIKEAGGGVEQALSNYFALRRNGLVFTTKIYKYTTSTSPVGVKMNANEGMVCEPSVGRNKGRDDYERYGLFHHFTCNFSVDENGFNHVDALEGQTGFTKYSKVQVGEVTMSAWFGIEDAGDSVLYHYSDSQTELTPRPMKECINPDGTLSPFMIHGKYVAGDIEGAPYSSKGLAPANGCRAAQARQSVSYTGCIGYMHKLGGHYAATTSWDLFYRQLMMIIRYATTHSQSIMAGCTSYSFQNMNLVEETGVMRVVLTKAQAANYVVGSYVSIGELGAETNKDRYYEYMHNLAYSVQITKIEDVDDTNAAIYVDAPEAFDTTLTTCISTMPWHTGSTDEVAGSDGSPNSNTNGKNPYKIQGIETCIGAYEVLGNVVMDIVTGADGNPVRDVYVCENASILTGTIATVKTTYKKAKAQIPYTAASWKYISEETIDTDLGIMIPTGVSAGSATGFADGLYTDTMTSGQREWLALGGLDRETVSGLWFLSTNYSCLNASWFIVSGVSPNGTRGEWQAAA
ncbi:hypothetical protein NE564_08170 [Blautia producta]|nr:hypothetical protein [Blautia producta]UOX59523.1 hypothetical protein K5I22_06710 [Clostridia bacterium UC5.1-1D4]